jgi:hypothetical protein
MGSETDFVAQSGLVHGLLPVLGMANIRHFPVIDLVFVSIIAVLPV